MMDTMIQNITKIVIYIWIILFSVLSKLLFAANSAPDFGSVVKIQPSICVLTKKQNQCQQTVFIDFIRSAPKNVCIYVKNNQQNKQCYNTNNVSQLKYKINTNISIQLIIENSVTGEVLNTLPFKVVQYKPVRKRRRFSWSLL